MGDRVPQAPNNVTEARREKFMPTVAIVLPVLQGKESAGRELATTLKTRSAEYKESRRRAGVAVERAYLQRNPDGSSLIIAYAETDGSFAESMASMARSELPIDRYFFEKNREVTGIDLRNAQGSDPERTAHWISPSATARRARGTAFTVPLLPGKLEQARKFADEAYTERKAELTKSREAKGMTREEVFIHRTPVRDMLVAYMEGLDPAEANRKFAASTEPFDTWFKDTMRRLFPPHIDFNKPAPAAEELFSWERS